MAKRQEETWDEPLQEILERLQIRAWDALLVGDGSGTTWKLAAGWACVAILRRRPHERRTFWGASSHGTNNLAEIMAYLPPLSWLVNELPGHDRHGARLYHQVHILTDSSYLVQMARAESAPRLHSPSWHFLQGVRRTGLVLSWHQLPRSSLGLNRFADQLAGACRRLWAGAYLDRGVETKLGRKAYEINPS